MAIPIYAEELLQINTLPTTEVMKEMPYKYIVLTGKYSNKWDWKSICTTDDLKEILKSYEEKDTKHTEIIIKNGTHNTTTTDTIVKFAKEKLLNGFKSVDLLEKHIYKLLKGIGFNDEGELGYIPIKSGERVMEVVIAIKLFNHSVPLYLLISNNENYLDSIGSFSRRENLSVNFKRISKDGIQ